MHLIGKAFSLDRLNPYAPLPANARRSEDGRFAPAPGFLIRQDTGSGQTLTRRYGLCLRPPRPIDAAFGSLRGPSCPSCDKPRAIDLQAVIRLRIARGPNSVLRARHFAWKPSTANNATLIRCRPQRRTAFVQIFQIFNPPLGALWMGGEPMVRHQLLPPAAGFVLFCGTQGRFAASRKSARGLIGLLHRRQMGNSEFPNAIFGRNMRALSPNVPPGRILLAQDVSVNH